MAEIISFGINRNNKVKKKPGITGASHYILLKI